MPAVIVVGAQWGDEGKGKIIDACTPYAKHIVRAQGGNNAGHTIIIEDQEYKLHLTPSGILHPGTQCYIGAGTVLDLSVLVEEWKMLRSRGVDIAKRLWISPHAHVILLYHKIIDQLGEKRKGSQAIGTTGRGIGPCYADKINRIGLRVGDLICQERFTSRLKSILAIKNDELVRLYDTQPIEEALILKEMLPLAEQIKPYVASVDLLLDHGLKRGESLLMEGAQGTFLDITSGTYPFVTSSNTTAAGICTGAEIGPTRISHTIGVFKAYTTRVGNGPFPTEVAENESFLDHHKAREFGTTTGRKRRTGWFDAVMAQAAIRYNGISSIALTKLDILDSLETIKVCVAYKIDGKHTLELPSTIEGWEKIEPQYEYLQGWKQPTTEIDSLEKLPDNARRYISKLEELCGIPLSILSVGPARHQTIICNNPFTAGNLVA